MKNYYRILALAIVLLFPVNSWAADKKWSALTAKGAPVAADTTCVVDSADGSSKKVTLGTLPNVGLPVPSTPATGQLYQYGASAWDKTAYTLAAPGTVGAILYSDGTNWIRTINPTASTINLYGANALTLGTSSSALGRIQWKNSTNTNVLTMDSGVTASNWSILLPTAPPAGNDYLLKMSTSGVLAYTDPATLGSGTPAFSAITGQPTDNTNLSSALSGKAPMGATAGPTAAEMDQVHDANSGSFRSGINTNSTLITSGVNPGHGHTPAAGATQTLQTAADGTSITPTADTKDFVSQTNAQSAGTLTLVNPTGTPVNGQKLRVQIKATSGEQTMAYGNLYSATTDVALPATVGASKEILMGFMYNSIDTKWYIVAMVNII